MLAGIGGMVWLRLTSLIVIPLLVDELGLALYGVWALSDIVISGQGLIDVGMLNATVKFVADADASGDAARARRVVRMSLVWYTALNAVALAVVAALLGPLPGWLDVSGNLVDDARVLIAGAAVLFVISNYAYVFGHALVGLQEAAIVNLAYAVSRLPYLAVIAATVVAHWGPWGVVGAGVVMYAGQVVWLGVVVNRRLPRGAPDDDVAVSTRELARFGSRTYIATLADFVVLQVPKLAATQVAGASSAGRYDLASRLPIVAAASAYPLQGPALAASARLTQHGRRDEAVQFAARATRALLAVILPLFGAIFIAGPEALRWWVGADGSGLQDPLRLLVPGLVLTTAIVPILSALTGSGHPGAVARYKLVLLVGAVVLVFSGGALSDLPGISAGVSIAALCSTVFLGYVVRETFGGAAAMSLLAAGFRPVVAATGGIVVAVIVTNAEIGGWPWLPATLLVVVTTLLWRPTGAIDSSDVKLVREAFARERSAGVG